ncbi:DUF1134 domain-containing protein [Sphingomonas jatrophae]|uniref:DUF1134 domain-containing protein n=1 Tax=Sphingomonas jatrophae TaxID=1166337 RepID=A0A1I6KXK2_9SPHN|nr:DUF1134 domain-containing protein [Sphingomonas jatrophae]SFR95934.1 hypothetical protein SAMN05192580_1886 [Sphingomonas jatrophae]
MPTAKFVRAAAAAALLIAAPALAQVRTVDPNAAMRGDLAPVPAGEAAYGTKGVSAEPTRQTAPEPAFSSEPPAATVAGSASAESERMTTQEALASAAADDPTRTYQRDDLLSAAEGVFGKGAEGLARILEDILKKQGQPSAYIGGREVGGAFVAGLRYGSGTLHHKVEGDMPVYWTGPSLGFDFGGNGAKSFVLVYNLYDTADLFNRFPQAEGAAYIVGGFTASYLRRGDIVLIPIRLGVGWRLGANVGYMRFSRKAKVSPF